MQPTDIELTGIGMRLRHSALYLDAHKRTELSFVSHAHGDHIARHKQVIATAPTLKIMEHRVGTIRTPISVPYHQRFNLGLLELELLPAGHVLGSAQLRITRNGRRIVYTGDLNVAPSLTAEATVVAHCDVLVMESTFGHPRYVFPPREQTYDRMKDFAERCFRDGVTPVFLSYPMGKSQEAMKAMTDRGLKVAAHSTIAQLCDLYALHGIQIPYRRFEHSIAPDEVLFFPPTLARSDTFKRITRIRRAILTGWAMDEGAPYRYGAEEAFPLSDHADYPGLMGYARATGAKKVFTVHGFAEELSAALREQGIDAEPLHPPKQLQML